MGIADTYVRARIDTETKERAASALEAMGLSISDAIRLLRLPLESGVLIESASTNLNPPMLVEVPCKSPTGLAQKVLFQVQRCRLNRTLNIYL